MNAPNILTILVIIKYYFIFIVTIVFIDLNLICFFFVVLIRQIKLNFMFLINIIRVLYKKLTASNTNEPHQYRRAVRATLILGN